MVRRVSERVSGQLQVTNAENIRKTWEDLVVNLKEFGALADGGDDTEAFQLAINYARSVGKSDIWIPPGTYIYNILVNSEDITFYGDNVTLSGSTVLVVTSFKDLINRINNIVANAGSGNSEIVDARLPLIGTAYPTLKGRLDAENTDVKNRIVNEKNERVAADKELSDRISSIVASAGNGNPEIVDARMGADGTGYSSLKDRLDAEYDHHDNSINAVANMLPINITTKGAVPDGSTDTIPAFNSCIRPITIDITSRLSNGSMTLDGNADGIADSWTSYADGGITGTLSMNSGQVATITASSSVGGRAVYQDISVTPGEVIKIKVTYKSAVTAGDFGPAIVAQARSLTGSIITLFNPEFPANNASETDYQTAAFTIPSGASILRVHFMAYAKAIGATGSATFRNVRLSQNTTNSYQVVKFPQNENGNAVYYFSSVPDLSAVQIAADNGVVFSFPTTNSISFKRAVFHDNVAIISRDRNNTGMQYENAYSDLLYQSLTENDSAIGVKKLSLVANADVQKNIYTANDTVVASATLAYDSDSGMYSMANPSDIAHATNKVVTTEFAFVEKNLYSCDFQFTTAETSANVALGITATTVGGDWLLYGLQISGLVAGLKNVSGSFSNFTAKNVQSLLNNAYLLKTGIIFAVRPVGNNKIEIYLNGFYIETVTVPFTFTKLGFGMIAVNASGQGLQNTQWGRIVTGACLKSNIGDTKTGAAFGDSITFGEGTLSWAEFLPNILTGQKGLTKVKIDNFASSGNTSAEQLAKIQATTLTPYDFVVILIGTNDIQGQVALSTFKSNVQGMITAAKATYRKVIIGIPPMWIDAASTGSGATTANYEKGAAYRSVIMQLAASNDIYIADTFSEIGRIGVDNVLNTLRDNLHPNEFGQLLLARCFSRSILAALNTDV